MKKFPNNNTLYSNMQTSEKHLLICIKKFYMSRNYVQICSLQIKFSYFHEKSTNKKTLYSIM